LTVYLTTAFNQFVNPWAISAIGWWYYVVYCGWLIAELIFILSFVVETKGRTLEETAALFDGEEQEDDLRGMGQEAATVSMNRSRLATLDLSRRPSVIMREVSMALPYNMNSRPTSGAFTEESDYTSDLKRKNRPETFEMARRSSVTLTTDSPPLSPLSPNRSSMA
jgi:hypothetical protein